MALLLALLELVSPAPFDELVDSGPSKLFTLGKTDSDNATKKVPSLNKF